MYRKIVIAGGTGFLGTLLIQALKKEFQEIVVLTRKLAFGDQSLKYVNWDGKSEGEWMNELDGADALINLTGKRLSDRVDSTYKDEVLSSRLMAISILEQAIEKCIYPPKVWITLSSIQCNSNLTENEETKASSWFREVMEMSETRFMRKQQHGTRKVILRSALVLSKRGGIFPYLQDFHSHHNAQDMSHRIGWVYEKDFQDGMMHVLTNEDIEGVVNLASGTQSLSNFISRICQENKRRLNSIVNKWLLSIGSWCIESEKDVWIQHAMRIQHPLQQYGFRPRYTNWKMVVNDLCK